MPRIASDKSCEKMELLNKGEQSSTKEKTKINSWCVVRNCDNVIQIDRVEITFNSHGDGFRDRDRDVVVATD